jgi:phosphopantothenoylcysteine decarboxylase/phosphopantothenate--cysteine ligase
VTRIDVESALEMREAVLREQASAAIVVMAAAVADFRPAHPLPRKLKKEELGEGATLTLELVANPDILAEISRERGARIVVGFAAESHDVLGAAQRKLARKGCDLLVANDISRSDAGFEVDANAVILLTPDGEVEELPLLPKRAVAARIFDRIEKLREGRRA